MIFIAAVIWQILSLNTVILAPQCGYPCLVQMVPMPHPPPPAPIGIPIPVGIPIRITETTTACTTKKEQEHNLIIINIVYPLPWPFTNKNFTLNLPPQLPQYSYPIAPPGLSFPYPIPGPPPVIMIPFPPVRILGKKPPRLPSKSESSASSSSSDSDSETSSSYEKKNRKKRNRYGIYRRYRRNNIGEVKPVLTYLSENGDVIFRRFLTRRDEDILMKENDSVQKVQIVAGEDRTGQSRVLVVAKPVKRAVQNKKIHLETSQRTLGEGKKEMIFRPPADKKITNLSVVFNIEK